MYVYLHMRVYFEYMFFTFVSVFYVCVYISVRVCVCVGICRRFKPYTLLLKINIKNDTEYSFRNMAYLEITELRLVITSL